MPSSLPAKLKRACLALLACCTILRSQEPSDADKAMLLSADTRGWLDSYGVFGEERNEQKAEEVRTDLKLCSSVTSV
jgi:hypothetical protein